MTAREQVFKVADIFRSASCEFAFLGGAVLGVLITDPAAFPVRATKDVDLLVDTPTRKAYADLEARLRRLGLRHDCSEGAPICRWRLDDIVLDVMPPSEDVLGWRSRWLPEALKTAVPMEEDFPFVRIVTPPYYLATKLEAFHGRGNGDFRASQDMEDIVTLVNGRASLIQEVEHAPAALRRDLGRTFRSLLQDRRFKDALAGHLGFGERDQIRLAIVEERMAAIACLAPAEQSIRERKRGGSE